MIPFKKYIHLKLIAVFTLLIFSGCAINPVTGKQELMFISEADEIEMGKNIYPNAIWGAEGGGGSYRNERLKNYLSNIINRVHSVSHRPHLPVSFEIQNSSVPNAWAIPGYVVITRGLLAALDNEAEFAFVMGHEMGHVSARHSAHQMSQGILLNVGLVATGLALGDTEGADVLLGLGAIGGNLLLLKFSRDDELQSDGLGVLYMTRIGYGPENAISAHRNLERISHEYLKSVGEDPHEKSFFEKLLSTHPRTQVRIEEIQHIINTTPKSPIAGDGTNRALFQSMITGLKNTNRIYIDYYDKAVRAYQKDKLKDAIHFLNRAITEDRFQPSFYTLTGFVYLKQKNYADAERYFNGAFTLDSDYQPAIRGLGMLDYKKENYSESIRYLKKGISLFPGDVLSHYFLGISYYKIKGYETAIPHLEKFAEASSNHSKIHGILGICYEKTKDINSAYNHYLKQLEIAPDNEMGRHAASRVVVLKPIIESPPKKKK